VCIGDSIFRGQPPVITWFRIVALFAVSAAVARELVVNGNAHLLPVVVTTFTELVDRYLAVWIYRQGGWVIIIIIIIIIIINNNNNKAKQKTKNSIQNMATVIVIIIGLR